MELFDIVHSFFLVLTFICSFSFIILIILWLTDFDENSWDCPDHRYICGYGDWYEYPLFLSGNCNYTKETMAKKYHVTRIMSVLQSTTVVAENETAAINASRKLKQNAWATVDNKRRKGYKATAVVYPTR